MLCYPVFLLTIKSNDMNQQTLANRANTSHFGHDVPAATDHKSPAPKNDGKQKKNNKSAPVAEAAPTAHEHTDSETIFHLDAPSAHQVLLAGNFTNWEKNAVKMIKGGGGIWHAKVPLKPGRHLYRFVVDGQWQNDPVRHEHVANPYGSSDTVLTIS
jgi:1,4-alpha-glucan branching enzyme